MSRVGIDYVMPVIVVMETSPGAAERRRPGAPAPRVEAPQLVPVAGDSPFLSLILSLNRWPDAESSIVVEVLRRL